MKIMEGEGETTESTALSPKNKKPQSLLEQLVENITDPKVDVEVRDGFFCSYRLTVKKKPADVLHALAQRFSEHAEIDDPAAGDICKKVAECIVHWIENYFEYDFMEIGEESSTDTDAVKVPSPREYIQRGYDFINNLREHAGISPMIAEFINFIDKVKESSMAFLAEDLLDALKEAVAALVTSDSPEEPIFTIQAFKPVAQYDAFLIAAHLTLVDFGLFKSMSGRDFLSPKSSKRTALINQANFITYWVVKVIVDEDDADKRLGTLKKLVEVAEALSGDTLKNFHGFMAVMSGLQLSPVARLKKTWQALEDTQPKLFTRFNNVLKTLADPGNGIYANVMEKVTGDNAVSSPCVPFLGSFLTAFERVKSQGKNKGSDDIEELARIQGDVAAAQQRLLKRVPTLQKGNYDWESFNLVPRFNDFLLKELPNLFDLSTGKARMDVEELLNKKSLICEPRVKSGGPAGDSV
eukprot:m.278683 g.278683  ORF g.278683 m.278683 type:complete len:467 (-) comp97141_c0_seq1:162-1562(-)